MLVRFLLKKCAYQFRINPACVTHFVSHKTPFRQAISVSRRRGHRRFVLILQQFTAFVLSIPQQIAFVAHFIAHFTSKCASQPLPNSYLSWLISHIPVFFPEIILLFATILCQFSPDCRFVFLMASLSFVALFEFQSLAPPRLPTAKTGYRTSSVTWIFSQTFGLFFSFSTRNAPYVTSPKVCYCKKRLTFDENQVRLSHYA